MKREQYFYSIDFLRIADIIMKWCSPVHHCERMNEGIFVRHQKRPLSRITDGWQTLFPFQAKPTDSFGLFPAKSFSTFIVLWPCSIMHHPYLLLITYLQLGQGMLTRSTRATRLFLTPRNKYPNCKPPVIFFANDLDDDIPKDCALTYFSCSFFLSSIQFPHQQPQYHPN